MGSANAFAAASALVAAGVLLHAHGRDARYVQDLAGQKPHFTRAIAASRSELGLSGSKRTLEMKTVDDQACAVASLIAFDVDDRYASDIDDRRRDRH